MANSAWLLVSNNELPSENSPSDRTLLSCKRAIPAFWLSLFSDRHLHSFDFEGDQGIIYLVATVEDAKRTMGERLRLFEELFPGANHYIEEWLAYWEEIHAGVVKADVDEILSRTPTGRLQLTEALRFLDDPTSEEAAFAFFALTSISDVIDGGHIVHRIETTARYSTLQRLMGCVESDA